MRTPNFCKVSSAAPRGARSKKSPKSARRILNASGPLEPELILSFDPVDPAPSAESGRCPRSRGRWPVWRYHVHWKGPPYGVARARKSHCPKRRDGGGGGGQRRPEGCSGSSGRRLEYRNNRGLSPQVGGCHLRSAGKRGCLPLLPSDGRRASRVSSVRGRSAPYRPPSRAL